MSHPCKRDSPLLRRLVGDMTTPRYVPIVHPEVGGPESQLALEQKTADELRVLLVESQMKLLQSRDYAIGAAARLGEFLSSRRAQSDYEIHIQNHLDHIARLEAALVESQQHIKRLNARSMQLDAVMTSSTWKIGRIVMLPVRALKRVRRRR